MNKNMNKNENSFFEYIVEYWDDTEKESVRARGVTYACSFADAICNIEEHYPYIEWIKCQGLEPNSCYDFEDSIMFKNEV